MAAKESVSEVFQTAVKSAWKEDDVAARYKIAENATRPFCKIMVAKSGLVQSTSGAHVFDLATGTGAAVKELYDAVPKEQWGNLKVLGGDISEGMLQYLQKRGEEEGWTGLETQVVDGNNIDLPKETFTHIFVSFAIFGMPGALPKLYDLLKPGGFIGLTTWTELPWQAQLARCIAQMPEKPYCPSSLELNDKMYSGKRWADGNFVSSQLSAAGFQNVQVTTGKNSADCGTPKVYIQTMQFPMALVTAFWEESKRESWLKELNALMLEDATREAGGEDVQVRMEFKANLGYGWKST